MARSITLVSLLSLLLALAGCGDSTRPSATGMEGGASYDGTVDPSGEFFLLQRLEVPVPGTRPVIVDLLGRNLVVDPATETVRIDVALRNQWSQALYAPAEVWLRQFRPATVVVTNADLLPDSIAAYVDLACWGFDYSELLGDDGALSPGETSGYRTWAFHDPGLLSFSFVAEGFFGLEPAGPEIVGVCFEDLNGNGIHERNEGPFVLGGVELRAPDGSTRFKMPDENGVYRFPVERVGLYRLTYHIMVDCICCVTSPNPLEVLLAPAPGGGPKSYYGADFGAHLGPCCDFMGEARVVNLEASLIDSDPYRLSNPRIVGDMLQAQVGFSGCSPDHPFELYVDENIRESMPLQTFALLSHDDRGELCDAWFERCVSFDLRPLRHRILELYGEMQPVLVRLVDFEGNEHELYYRPDLLPE